jgi:hypothetical protein
MTIDERLEKLVERHEALTQTVEHLAREQQITERQIRRLGRYMRSMALMVLDHEARLRSIEGDENGDREDGP